MSQIKKLKQLGLNNNEAEAYLALLKMEQCTISKLGLEILIPRTTLYYSIQGLKEKGFIFERIKGKKRYFSPRQPDFLAKKASAQLEKAKEINNKTSDLIKSLKKITKNSPSNTKIEHYEGKDGVWEVFEKILRLNEDSFWFGFGENFLDNYDFNFFFDNFTKKRRQYGKAKTYSIVPAFDKITKIKKRGDVDFQEIKLLNDNKQNDAGICIFGNYIGIFSYEKDISATVIEGKAVSDIVKSMFFMIWDNLD